ncbi:MAG: IS6 family transposase [Francisellaceae bacterium]|jgi:putative transposase|nr:IS6 family transposase [Francisellaceae bacterium]MBT6207413.1 IS6 family transposase [Francisellaceae bacterium]MBT6537850.1 IS6 family transposase [Francisellaceae bacterium]
MKLREHRKGQSGNKWHTDATYVKIAGNWCYLYRAIDREGNLVDVYLSDTRDQVAPENFFKQALVTTNVTPIQITTDKERALYPAIKNIFPDAKHRDSKYMNNRIEQNHRGIKSRYKVMKGFKSPFSALIFCTVSEEIRQLHRAKDKTRAVCRGLIMPKFKEFNNLLANAA